MEAVALYDFQPSNSDELGFSKNSVLKIMKLDECDWYYAEDESQRKGVIPSNFIRLTPSPWFMQDLNRHDSEKHLQSTPEGTFLIRISERSGSKYSLSVMHDCKPLHFKIFRNVCGDFFIWKQGFSTLNELVAFYKNNSLADDQQIFLVRSYNEYREQGPTSPCVFFNSSSKPTVPNIAPVNNKAKNLYVQGLFDFQTSDMEELPFKKDDIILVLEKEEEEWWKGELNNRQGLFPVNYVKILDS